MARAAIIMHISLLVGYGRFTDICFATPQWVLYRQFYFVSTLIFSNVFFEIILTILGANLVDFFFFCRAYIGNS